MVSTILDSGASINIINKDLVDLLDLQFQQKSTEFRIQTLTSVTQPLGESVFKVILFGQEYPVTAHVVDTRIFGGLLVGTDFMAAAKIDIINSTGHLKFGGEQGISIRTARIWDSPTVIQVSGVRERMSCKKCCSFPSKDDVKWYPQVSEQDKLPVIQETEEVSDHTESAASSSRFRSRYSSDENRHSDAKDRNSKQHDAEGTEKSAEIRGDIIRQRILRKTGNMQPVRMIRRTVVTRWLPTEYGENDADLIQSASDQTEEKESDPAITRSARLVKSGSVIQRSRRLGHRKKIRRHHSNPIRKKPVYDHSTDSESTDTLSDTGLSDSPDIDTDSCPLREADSADEKYDSDGSRKTFTVLHMPDEWEALGLEKEPDPVLNPVINTDLNPDDIKRIAELVKEFPQIFSHGEYDIGVAKVTPVILDTGNHQPITSPTWRMKPALNEELERQIRELLKAGIIEPSTGPWNFPPVLVEKKSTKKYRLTINYQKLNNILKKNAMIPPDIEVLLDRLGGRPWKSVLDARSGYFHIPLAQESREKTAFRGTYGLYQFTRLPQGLATAPAIFQTAMNEMLGDLKDTCALAYMDDVIVFSSTLDEHISHLQQVFQRIQEFGLKMSLDKSKFAMLEIEFLGRIITEDGIRPDPKKIQAIQDFNQPSTQKEVMRFKGMCSFHRRLIKDFSLIMEPLQRMINDRAVRWGPEQEKAFKQMKQIMSTAPILRFPDFNRTFYVVCDASNYHLGALLKQKDDKKHMYIVACESRKLNSVERRYATTYREFLGILFGVTKFDRYVTGRKFIIVTDHHALCYMLKMLRPGKSAIVRWVMNMREYDFEIEWTSGASHKEADCLSRPPGCEEAADQEDETAIDERFHCLATQKYPLLTLDQVQQVADSGWDELPKFIQSQEKQIADQSGILMLASLEEQFVIQVSDMKDRQAEDGHIQGLISYLTTGEVPASIKNKHRFIKKMEHYKMSDGLICRQVLSVTGDQRLCPVVPKSLYLKILQAFHDSATAGHQGIRNTMARLRERYFWEGMYKHVENYVRSCIMCLENNIVRTAAPGELMPLPSTCLPGEILSLDTMTDLTRTKSGKSYLFVCTDRATRFVWAMAARTKEADYAVKLLQHVIFLIGPPREVLTDNGREYTNSKFNSVCEDHQIFHGTTSRYHPQSNGQTERMNATLIQVLKKYCRRDTNWDQHLAAAVYSINTSPNSHTEIAPYVLMFGMLPPSPVRHAVQESNGKSNDFHAMKIIEQIRETAAEKLAAEQREYKRKHDERIPKHQYCAGDWVMLKRHVPEKDRCRKLSQRYAGPYQITKVHPNNTVDLLCEDQRLYSNRVNVGELRPAPTRDPELQPHQSTAAPDIQTSPDRDPEETSSVSSQETEILSDSIRAVTQDDWEVVTGRADPSITAGDTGAESRIRSVPPIRLKRLQMSRPRTRSGGLIRQPQRLTEDC